MKVTEHIERANGKTVFSFEILPPLKGHHIRSIFDNIEPLLRFDPKFIDVTYHREEYQYKYNGQGLWKKQVVKKRPGTVGICAAIQNKYKVDAVPHVLCGGFTREETENFLIDLDFLEIDNVLALRGDPVKNETYFRAEPDGHSYASELIEQIAELNQGRYLDEEMKNSCPMDFCIGAAAYPEKHMEAPSLESDLFYLKKKIEKGASYVITQMGFDNQKYFDFVERCRKEGITVPIIPGLKPISSKRQLTMLPHRFHVDLPNELVLEVLKCKTNKEVKEVGIEWCIEQSRELKEGGAPVLHYYCMGKSDDIERIAEAVF